CNVGHVVCSPCRDKLKATSDKCHECRGATGGFRRCHGMERLVESICVPCPHAADGCTAWSAYYDLDAHRQKCPHARCRCPDMACGFVGLTEALLDHFAGVHGWPDATKVRVVDDYRSHNLRLRDGFNFLLVDHVVAAAANREYLFLLDVARQPHGVAISVVHICPRGAAGDGQGSSSKEIKCALTYSWHAHRRSRPHDGDQFMDNYYQSARFRVTSTDLSNGLPSPDGCFQFVVLNSVLGDGDKDAIEVRARIIIS
ncbi:hypothetical protein BAE44_0020985, partial [Dichanthelium oligosanthes]